jgi:condensin complex subunit 2
MANVSTPTIDVSQADASANKTRREKKEAFRIDFLTPSEQSIKETNKKLFAPSTRGMSITLAAKKKSSKVDDQTLPDDMHFSSRQLVTLFLKPKFAVSRSSMFDCMSVQWSVISSR